MLIALDIFSHWFQMYSTLLAGSTTHKVSIGRAPAGGRPPATCCTMQPCACRSSLHCKVQMTAAQHQLSTGSSAADGKTAPLLEELPLLTGTRYAHPGPALATLAAQHDGGY